MRIKAIAKRILTELRRDKRTLALVLFAPLLILTLIYFVLNSDAADVKIGVINAPQRYVEALYENNIRPVRLDEADARQALVDQEIAAAVSIENGKPYYLVDGSDPTRAGTALKALQAAGVSQNQRQRQELAPEIEYLYGSAELELFDNYGSALTGFVVFFFVFLIAGINFLTERTSGTLEKMLSTPTPRREIVFGYILGYGAVTVLQTVIITCYLIYVLKVMMIGALWLVMLITLMTSMCALSLGMLLSSAAQNEFQFVQFIPVAIIPQVFFCGLFPLSEAWERVGYLMPLQYAADALSRVMLRSDGPGGAVLVDLCVLALFSGLFISLNIRILKKHRTI